jgi:hypothetical protein
MSNGGDMAIDVILVVGVLLYVCFSGLNTRFFWFAKKWNRIFQIRFFSLLLIVSVGRTFLLGFAVVVEMHEHSASWCNENPVCRISLLGVSAFLDMCLYSCVVILILFWLESWKEMNKRVGSVANAPRPPLASRTHDDMNRYHKILYYLVGVLSVLLYGLCWLGFYLFGEKGPMIVYTICEVAILLPLIIISSVWLFRHGRRLRRFLKEAEKVQELSEEIGQQISWVPTTTRTLLKRINSMALLMTCSLFLRFVGVVVFFVLLEIGHQWAAFLYIVVNVLFEAIPCCFVAVACRPRRRINMELGSATTIRKQLLPPTDR